MLNFSMISCRTKDLIFIFFGALAIRLVWLYYASPIPVSDFEGYRLLAENLLETGQFGIPDSSAYRLPVYPVLLSLTMLISRSIFWLNFVNVVISSLMVPLLYMVVEKLSNGSRKVALIASLFCLFNPTFIFSSSLLCSESIFSVLILIALWLVLSIKLTWKTKAILSGFIYGLAVLTKGEGLFYLPVFACLLFLFTAHKRRMVSLLLFSVVTAGVLFPWLIRNHYVVGPGAGLSTTSGLNFYYAHNERNREKYVFHPLSGTPLEGLSEIKRNQKGFELGWVYLTEESLFDYLYDVAMNTWRLLGNRHSWALNWSLKIPREKDFGPYPEKPLRGIPFLRIFSSLFYFLLLALATFSFLLIRKIPIGVWLLAGGVIFFNWIGYCWIYWAKTRYRFTLELIFSVLAAYAFLYFINRIKKRHLLSAQD